ncbi:MAG: AraC family transcriptional regulator [Victivallales bacterium]|jgi:AraC-like DNA-binding protein
MNIITDSLKLNILNGNLTDCGVSWANAGRSIITDPFNRMYWVKSGYGYVEHHGITYRLVPGRLYLIPAYSPGRYWCSAEMKLCWCHFTASVLANAELFGLFKCEYEMKISEGKMSLTGHLWDIILKSFRSGNISDSTAVDGALRLLLSFFLETADAAELKQGREVFEKFSPAFKHIEENISKEIKISELARTVNLQENYFTNLFTKYFKTSPVRYVNLQKIKHAQKLMYNSSLSLKEIAQQTGFSNEFYFSRVFRKTAGMPPGEFRRRSSKPHP